MNSAIVLLILLLKLYILVLIFRIIIEMVQSFSRNWRPQRWFSICAEPIFVVTDPPVKALRKLIPPVQLGGVGLDVSVLVLFFILQLLMMILGRMLAL
ncbi:YggT family protein [Corynebacterium auriscanis]|uniref:YggT family protein n=1 Tax=Corynebacterium auriscanis TaxID=99807 RepID=UPI003CFA3C46